MATPILQTKILSFDPVQYPFHEVIAELIEVDDLTTLHMAEDKMKTDWSFYKNMEQSDHFGKLYRKLDSEAGDKFYDLYKRFIHEEIRPLFSGRLFYQVKPSHRLFFKNLIGQDRFHKDQDYGHQPEEINFLVPQTPAFETNTLWIESQVGREDYEPVSMELGEYVQFKGSLLRHGAFQNTTDQSRVSFDFRVVPAENMSPDFVKSQNISTQNSGNPIMDNAQRFTLCE